METVQPVTPPSCESVTHRINTAGGTQIDYIGDATHVVSGARHAYAESVSESFVTEDVEDDIALEDPGWETKDANDAISDSKKSASPTSSEFTIPRSESSAVIQNSNAGIGIKLDASFSSGNQNYHYNNYSDDRIMKTSGTLTRSHIGNIYQSSGGCMLQNVHFYGNPNFRAHAQDSNTGADIRISGGGIHVNDNFIYLHQGYNYQSGTRPIIQDVEIYGDIDFGAHAQDSDTEDGLRISGGRIHVKEKCGCEVHVKNSNDIKIHRCTDASEVMACNTTSDRRGRRDRGSHVVYGGIYNTGGGSQIKG